MKDDREVPDNRIPRNFRSSGKHRIRPTPKNPDEPKPEKSIKSNPTKKHDINDLDFWKDLAVDNIGLTITATSVLIAGTRLAFVSGGNLQLASAIVQSMNVLNLIFITLLPVVPYIIQLAIVQYLYNHRHGNKNSDVPPWGKIVFLAGFLIAATFTPIFMLLVYILAGLIIYVVNKYVTKISYQVSVPAFSIFLIASAAIQATGPWLPMEQIRVKNEGTVYAYVLSSDVRWTTALTKNKSIRIYTTSDLEGRTICNSREHWLVRTLSGWRIGEDLPSCN